MRSAFLTLILVVIIGRLEAASPTSDENELHYEKLVASDLKLPDSLLTLGGEGVDSVEMWKTKRRPEILELFRENIYGRMPVGRPEEMRFEVTDVAHDAMEGKATRKLVKISFRGPHGEGAIHLVLFIPKGLAKPPPCFLLICNRSPENIDPTRAIKSPFWPAEQMIARGYAAAAFHNGDLAPDKNVKFNAGVHQIFDEPGQRKADSWATIAAWAWGASRVMDYLQTDPDIDAKHVAVVGHSRGGKTALWAGAEDERFAMTVSNDSGSTGAALARGKKGETIKGINKRYPHWFCDNYKHYDEREKDLPVDQHMLLALIAPRLLYVASATADRWPSEYLGAVHSGPVYELFGFQGLPLAMPQPETPIHMNAIGYHLRTGKHDLTEYDWGQFMDFADKHWRDAADR